MISLTTIDTVADTILLYVGKAEGAIAHYTAPLETAVNGYLSQLFPSQYEFLSSWLQSVQSVHAKKLPLMNLFHVILIIALYLFAVTLGKSFMGRREEKFTVKTFAKLHNLILMSLSAYMCGSVIHEAYLKKYSLFANPADESKAGFRMAKLIWVFYFSKILEFIDTFIMVLKKNFRQISFLHVYHHASIFFIWWLVTFMAPTGEAYFSAFLNSFIHVVMYGYYLCSSLGITWISFIKHYITMMQMTQFCLMMVQSVYDIYYEKYVRAPSTKSYPLELSVLLFVYMWTMLGLFANFLINDRRRVKALRETSSSSASSSKAGAKTPSRRAKTKKN